MLLACAPPRPTAPTRFWFGGDVHLGHHGAEVLRDVGLRGAGVVNLEGPIATGEASESRLVNGPQTAQALAADGIRVAWIDNNHALDVGPDGPARTKAVLEREGISTAGTAQLGTTVFVGADLSHGVPPDLAARLDAVKADTLIAGFHVTSEATLLPTDELEAAVALALQHGAHVVVAHGTHAVARVERRGEAVIAWGLGNLAFDCDCTDARDGLALEVELDGPFINAWAVPVSAGLHGAPATLSVQPELMFDLLRSLDSSSFTREGVRARF